MPNSPLLIEAFTQRFIDGGSFSTIVAARNEAGKLLNQSVEPGTSEAKLVDEAVERAVVRASRYILEQGEGQPIKEIYEQMVDLYQRQPTLGTRSSTSIAQQAYSTPVPIAFLAASLAKIDAQTSVYEPTAGNGMLLMRASPERATVNELNQGRAADLEAQGYSVTRVDATVYAPLVQQDVVIANPPFGSIPDDDGRTKRFSVGPYTTTQIDHVIALNALKVMKPEGRAVLILGGKLGEDEQKRSDRYNSQMTRAFYYTLYNNYKVTEQFSIWGDLYRRQGAGFPIDVILIEGRGKSERPLPAAEVPRIYHSFNDLKELLPDVPLLSVPQRLGTDGRDGAENSGRPGASRTPRGLSPGFAGTFDRASGVDDPGVDGGSASQPSRDLPPDQSAPMGGGDVPMDSQAGGLSSGVGQSDRDQQQRPPGADQPPGDRVPGTGDHRSADSSQSSLPDNRGSEPGGVASESVRDQVGLSQGDNQLTQAVSEGTAMPSEPNQQSAKEEPIKQVPYIPHSQGKSVDTLVPVNMGAGIDNALNALEQRVGTIDEYVADRLAYGTPEDLHKHYSAEQVDACALALSNLEQGSGFIIGDQTGIGKGRIVAAMIRYASQTGRTPIFVTQNPTLYADMLRDLNDIGMANFQAFCTNSTLDLPLSDGGRLQTSPKTHQAEFDLIRRTGVLAGYDAIFTTYSQMQTVKGEETPRRDFLRQFAQGSVLIMDESHEAGGTASEGRKSSNVAPNRAEFVRELIEQADGVFYSSATYAKRPDVMDLYSKTDMRLAVSNMEKLVGMVERGGVPLQQALASQLVEAGQYIRRERSFEGISFEAVSAPVDHQVAENMSAIMSSIMEFDNIKKDVVSEMSKELKAGAKAVLGDGSTGAAGASSTNFTSIMHNIIDQSLLAMKAEETVQKSLSLLRQPEPEKPLIALSSTMGSFIGNYAQLNDLKPGDSINLDFGDLLRRYLDRSREVLVGDPYGEKKRHRLTDLQLGPEAVEEYERVVDLIEETDFSQIPISPIDYIKARLSQEGYRVNEITGRQDIVDYGSDGSTTYDRRTPKQVSKATAIRNVQAFNDGNLDVIILNRSGSTGISLHASEKFADQRPRHMIVAQAERDINLFMQTIGRINRTGQVIKPSFTLLMADIPAEKRPGAVLCKKLASLNANTTASRSGGVSLDTVPDFMNSYGDQIAAEIMENNPAIYRRLGEPLKGSEDELDTENAISRVTGRIPLLPIADQEKIYSLIEKEYTEFVQRQEAMGESILEAGSMDLDARTLARIEVMPADAQSESPFTSAVYVEVADVKTTRKPLTTLEVLNVIRQELELPDALQVKDHDFENFAQQANAFAGKTVAAIEQEVVDYSRGYFARPRTDKDTNKFNDRLARQFEHVRDVLTRYPVGETIQINTGKGSVFYGVGARAWNSRGEGRDNPTTPATWKMQLLLADSARELTLPFSKINVDKPGAVRLIPQQQDWLGVEIYDRFDAKQGRNREERQIFTGNILRAYEKYKGKLINFTDNQGQIRQGLLAPDDFDIEENLEKQAVVIPTSRQIVAFINEATDGKGVVKSLDQMLVIKQAPQRKGGGFIVQAAKSPEMGDKFYLNPEFIQAAGAEFYSVGDRMELRVPQERINVVLEQVQEKGIQLAAFDKRDVAREMLGIVLPSMELIERGEFEAKGDVIPFVSPVDNQVRSSLEEAFQKDLSTTQPETKEQPKSDADQPPPKLNIPSIPDSPLPSPPNSSHDIELPKPSLPPESSVSEDKDMASKLLQWFKVVKDLGRTEKYQERVTEVTQTHQAGEPLSDKAREAMARDFQAHGQLRQLRSWYHCAGALGKSEDHLRRITETGIRFKAGNPLSETAVSLMHEDLEEYANTLGTLNRWRDAAGRLERPLTHCTRISEIIDDFRKGQPISKKASIVMEQDLKAQKQKYVGIER